MHINIATTNEALPTFERLVPEITRRADVLAKTPRCVALAIPNVDETEAVMLDVALEEIANEAHQPFAIRTFDGARNRMRKRAHHETETRLDIVLTEGGGAKTNDRNDTLVRYAYVQNHPGKETS